MKSQKLLWSNEPNSVFQSHDSKFNMSGTFWQNFNPTKADLTDMHKWGLQVVMGPMAHSDMFIAYSSK